MTIAIAKGVSKLPIFLISDFAGHHSTVFNTMSNVQVGGKFSRNGRNRIERPFAGVIAGLSVNKLRILDLAVERDPQITIRGDVHAWPPWIWVMPLPR